MRNNTLKHIATCMAAVLCSAVESGQKNENETHRDTNEPGVASKSRKKRERERERERNEPGVGSKGALTGAGHSKTPNETRYRQTEREREREREKRTRGGVKGRTHWRGTQQDTK